jgi:hypothetical protein
MPCFCLQLVLFDCSAGLLGHEDEVPADSASKTGLLLTDCSGDSATGVEGTAFETADAEMDAGSAWVCIKNICSIVIGAGVAAAVAGVPHPTELAALAEHTFLLCACFLTFAKCNHTSELILQLST